MENDQEKIAQPKQQIMDAVVEWERQELIQTTVLFAYQEQLKSLAERIEKTLLENRATSARMALQKLLASEQEWASILTDTQLEAWQTEALSWISDAGSCSTSNLPE